MESSLKNLARACHVVSVFWVLVLAIIIFIDVSGRFLFAIPLLGAPEIIKNSVVSITFLQLPLAIYRGGMIRTTLAYDRVSPDRQLYLRSLANILGFLFFQTQQYYYKKILCIYILPNNLHQLDQFFVYKIYNF